jgi:hypothetical protein
MIALISSNLSIAATQSSVDVGEVPCSQLASESIHVPLIQNIFSGS